MHRYRGGAEGIGGEFASGCDDDATRRILNLLDRLEANRPDRHRAVIRLMESLVYKR